MLQSLGWAALGTGFTFLMTALGAAMVFFFAGEPRPHFQKTLLGFAAGVMTAASVWSLLLPAIDRAAEGALPDWLPAAGGMLLGVVFLSALDALLPHLRRDRTWQDASWRQTTLLMTAITLHNVPEGMAVGLAFALVSGGEGFAGAAALASASRIFRREPPWLCPCGRAAGPVPGPLWGECSPAPWSRCSACWRHWPRPVWTR